MIVANVAIVFGVIYKLFELFVGKKERVMMIEKLSAEDLMKGGMRRPDFFPFTFSSLRFGFLIVGMGVGLLAGYFINWNMSVGCTYSNSVLDLHETLSLIYGACVLLGGGLGLLISFMLEWKLCKKNQK